MFGRRAVDPLGNRGFFRLGFLSLFSTGLLVGGDDEDTPYYAERKFQMQIDSKCSYIAKPIPDRATYG